MLTRIAFEASYFDKIAANKLFLYTFVPKLSLDSIKSKGLLSAAKLIQDGKALSLARPKDKEDFKAKIKEDLKDPDWKDIVSGVSAFFTLPDWSKLPKNHNIFRLDTVPVKINLSLLMKEMPDTRLYGVELEKYDDSFNDQPNREKDLKLKEVESYIDELPSLIWENYDASKKKMYAPDVPHVIIITKEKKIPAKYLVL